MKRLAILGSTGSIGTQALDVVAAHPGLFEVEVLSAHSNATLLIEQARRFKPNAVVVTDETKYKEVKDALMMLPIKVFTGHKALAEVVQWDTVDTVLGAVLGFAGLHSILAAIDAGKRIALANKETLVVAGELVMARAREKGAVIIPVDSEHSAIFQCLAGEDLNKVEKVILTASGGPFLGRKPNYLVNVKASHALQHPNWVMGAKITIDSATLMNKGLEIIEAKWLFALNNDQIDVVIHPQSVIHSMVQFTDGSVKSQMGLPDMKLPIQYAIAYPERIHNDYKRLDFKDFPKLSFEAPDYKTFRNLALAIDAMKKGGNAPCVLNAANEVVVHAFLQNKVGFLEMSEMIEKTLDCMTFIEHPTIEEYVETDKEARIQVTEFLKKSQLSIY
ncbi:1-deoxy-D-xylulose-5-phosphate reductoisomerase [Flavipsychrobacter stenotrophus]|uniref:1-deoxy-D-xylulose 5-phosphate reductoisomerase n=1 Tax=Flavipsychrobacter stenotrophus TaxID=2077091 RepID=A0A2S7SX12_9BACT|nr:1-deoxy-D-xylulose-5-phosphate reductoisomerase [Flavipsychrobacter stenotrophus]PQJ11463.1 1-deoxy-D-xylulose-5-phosphate reductoisomerase [Flavipsychrobacter stenotrophus]